MDKGQLLLRIVFGGGMLYGHGLGKFLKLLEGPPFKFGDPIGLGSDISLGLAVFAEFLCALLIIIGFKTRWATIPLIITMLVAVFIVHWDDPFGSKEKGILYLTGYLAILMTGPGWYSIDEQIRK
jgi:putative oxidoreductase